MGPKFGPKVGSLEDLSCSAVACLTGDTPATLSSPPAKLGAIVSRDLGVHFTCCLHDFDPEYAIYISMHLVWYFASII